VPEDEHAAISVTNSWIDRVVTFEVNSRAHVSPDFLDVFSITDRPLWLREANLKKILLKFGALPISEMTEWDLLFRALHLIRRPFSRSPIAVSFWVCRRMLPFTDRRTESWGQ